MATAAPIGHEHADADLCEGVPPALFPEATTGSGTEETTRDPSAPARRYPVPVVADIGDAGGVVAIGLD
ncbi:hypothetical protein [Parafrankia discariae]|uniref:hypothetical protein n=1 Tax=Parafrankia discariae TaxID=365528 RepID=UPI0012B6AC28|nr:hypothetical protein [Parafrankia discariae]